MSTKSKTYLVSLNLSFRSVDEEGLVSVSDSYVIVSLVVVDIRYPATLEFHFIGGFGVEVNVVDTIGFVVVSEIKVSYLSK